MVSATYRPGGLFRRLLRRHEASLLLAVLVVLGLTTILDSGHNYLRDPGTSFEQILRQTTLLGIFSLGAAIVIIAGGIDLSSGSVICFSGTICATILLLVAPEQMQSPDTRLGTGVIAVAIGGTLLVGFLIGSLHAWLITVVGVPPFVATLATLVGLRSFARAVCENATEAVIGGRSTQINIFDERFRYLATSVWIPAVLFLLLSLACWLMLSRTVLGRHLYALGGNEEAARLSGIRTDRLKWIAYSISAMLSSIAGILYICEQSVAEPQTLGRGYELNAIAAAVVGGCSLQGGIGTIPGTVLGALFLRTVIDGVSKIIKTGADVYEGLIVGIVVVFAVAFGQLERGVRRQQFFSGALGLVTVVNLAVLAAALTALIGPKLLSGPPGGEPWLKLDARYLALLAGTATLALLLVVRSEIDRNLRRVLYLLLAVTLIASALGLDAWLPRFRYDRAVAAVEEAGGRIVAVEDGSAVDLNGLNIDDRRLKSLVSHMRYLTDLTELRLGRTNITDEGLTAIAELPTLRRLDVRGTEVTDFGVGRLRRSLRGLSVAR